MANIKSQIKRNRQNEKRQLRNKAIRSELKTRSKNALLAAESGDADQAAEALRLAQQRIDTAVAKGVLHKNTAAAASPPLPPGAVLPRVRDGRLADEDPYFLWGARGGGLRRSSVWSGRLAGTPA